MVDLWNAFWFSGNEFINLAAARIIIIGYFLFVNLNSKTLDLAAWQRATVTLKRHWKLPYLLSLLKIPILPPKWGIPIIHTYKIALGFVFIGLFTSYAAALALVLGLYSLGIRHGLKINHPYIPIHFFMLVFCIAPASVEFSIDSLLFFTSVTTEHEMMAAAWGIRVIQVTIAIVIFATGIAKIRHLKHGGGFVKQGGLSNLLRLHDFPYFYASPILSISNLLHRFPLMEKTLSWTTIFFELTFPLVLFSDVARAVLVPGFIFCILAFRIFQGPFFDFFIAVLVAAFVPWSILAS